MFPLFLLVSTLLFLSGQSLANLKSIMSEYNCTYHEGSRQRKRDGQTWKDEQREKWMDGELDEDGQWRVISNERMEKQKGRWMDR